jgi:flavin reductase (DIM6/NTAB) family NADH-FMN oxidoreductase RutF
MNVRWTTSAIDVHSGIKEQSMKMRTIIPGEIPVKDMHQYLLGTVSPRPIAFVSTVNEDGQPNLAPYSFFNVFSSNPPIAVFSSNRRVHDNTTKDTLHNVKVAGECVINAVTYDIVRQMAIASVAYDSDINEFDKAGLTAIPSDLVKPFRVKESPAQMECKVREIIPLGEHGGAGHLIICDVLRMHIAESVIDGNRIDPHKMDLMGRMGRAYYVRASGDAVHTIVQSVVEIAIGFDSLPQSVRQSTILTGNQLGIIAGLLELPDQEAIDAMGNSLTVSRIVDETGNSNDSLHRLAAKYIDEGQCDDALALLLFADSF